MLLIRAAARFVPIACKSDDARDRANASEIADLTWAIAQECGGGFLSKAVSPQEGGEILRSHSVICDVFDELSRHINRAVTPHDDIAMIDEAGGLKQFRIISKKTIWLVGIDD